MIVDPARHISWRNLDGRDWVEIDEKEFDTQWEALMNRLNYVTQGK